MKTPLQFLASRLPRVLLFAFSFWTGALLLSSNPAFSAIDSSTAQQADQAMSQGLQDFQRGRFERAVRAWTEVVRLYETAGKPAEQSDVLTRLAEAYQALGRHPEALDSLQRALKLAQQTGDQVRMAAILGSLGNAFFLAGTMDQANDYLDRGLAKARKTRNSAVAAAILNTQGTLWSAEQRYPEARAAFEESLQLARRVENHALATKVLTNTARLSLQTGDSTSTGALLEAANAALGNVTPSHFKAYALIDLGQLARRLQTHAPAPSARWRLLAYQAFKEAADIAAELGDTRASSYALGYLGQLYEAERRNPEALDLTRRAAFAAQEIQAPESLYLWQWQTGRLLTAQGDTAGAIAAYRQAVRTLQFIRQDLSLTFRGNPAAFRGAVGAVYVELADLLLQSSTDQPDQEQVYLGEAQETMELLKAAELQDYFQDECVTALQSRITRVDRPPAGTAVVYPILLPDRTELLLSVSGGIKRFVVPVGAERLTQEVRSFRRLLEKRTTREFLPHGQRLYDWLIRPMTAALAAQQVHTLVLVPAGALRTIPMAALHDGNEFLISQYALATTPGLTLTDLRPFKREQVQLLLSGLTEPVQGFSALPYVSVELETIQRFYGGKRLENPEFRVPAVEKELTQTPYSIVHFASHGQFSADPRKTFVLAFDGKLSMDRLEQFMGLSQFRDQPVELLTLSACQTAAGDDRAALGLAGVAVKAGARSALATLWLINDQATALLVGDFYRQLKDPSVSKARALQRAQLSLLNDPRYRHPGYWSPFLLIGNWL
jgi:CHAT domain-containing protein/Tfp pilus assembly protein PilF